ncbi:MAG TPA: hypothetical protein P5105_03865, partial [Victivallales bacterium]|nr:hypothetical protein [Victivallales bacterium]
KNYNPPFIHIKINNKSNEVKDILENLKQQPLSKNNLIISSDKKYKLLEYIKDIDKNNKNMKSITNFNLSLNDIKKDLEENHETIKELLNENEDLNVKLEEKERLLQVSKNTISDLKKKIFNLEEQINYWKNKFTKIVNHIKDKVLGLFGKDEEHTYRNIANDLYMNNKVSYEDYESMLGRNVSVKYKQTYWHINQYLFLPSHSSRALDISALNSSSGRPRSLPRSYV